MHISIGFIVYIGLDIYIDVCINAHIAIFIALDFAIAVALAVAAAIAIAIAFNTSTCKLIRYITRDNMESNHSMHGLTPWGVPLAPGSTQNFEIRPFNFSRVGI